MTISQMIAFWQARPIALMLWLAALEADPPCDCYGCVTMRKPCLYAN